MEPNKLHNPLLRITGYFFFIVICLVGLMGGTPISSSHSQSREAKDQAKGSSNREWGAEVSNQTNDISSLGRQQQRTAEAVYRNGYSRSLRDMEQLLFRSQAQTTTSAKIAPQVL